MKQRKRTPYERIVWAANRGFGLRLTPAEVALLSEDEHIFTRAEHDENVAIMALLSREETP